MKTKIGKGSAAIIMKNKGSRRRNIRDKNGEIACVIQSSGRSLKIKGFFTDNKSFKLKEIK